MFYGWLQWLIELDYTAVQSQKAVTAYFSSKQLLPSGFADQYRQLDVSLFSTNNLDIHG